jgi:para-aminobenzoate synthetase/4-amino-4-deoxychorismate lyase
MNADVWALLDDAAAAADGSRRSRLYTDCQEILEYRAEDARDQFFADLQRALERGLHAVGLFQFEFGHQLQGLPVSNDQSDALAVVLLFADCQKLDTEAVEQWLSARSAGAPYGVSSIQPALQEAEFAQAIDTIHQYIEAGDTYQVNFTFPLHFEMYGDPVALYTALRARQPVPYGALVALPDGSSVLSLSPELFVSHAKGRLTCRPMKGTAAVSGDVKLDAQRVNDLQNSEKERSENLMIVDLLRNDLGRIAVTGSVKVPDLFTVDSFGSVLQMTSTIEADLREDHSLAQVFDALYPCGSITGAPKRRTMQILRELERWPRRLYTGAIGWFDPPSGRDHMGDFMLSVPIRTLLLDAPDANDRRRAELAVGAGIVYDSDAQAEYQECLLKARFLTGVAPGFSLFETMHAGRDGCALLERHLKRLSSSAASLGFCYDEMSVRTKIAEICSKFDDERDYRVRIALEASGDVQVQVAPIAALIQPVRVLLSTVAMHSDDALLAHKTTLRRAYDEGWRYAESVGAFDMLFFNERGELTEGGRSSVFVRIGGRWFTPPLSAGVLPGVMRSVLLDDSEWNATERTITREDLIAADEVCVCNALRGVLRVSIVNDGD